MAVDPPFAAASRRPAIPDGLRSGGVIAIGRRLDPHHVEAIADGLLDGGIGAFELTLNEPEAAAVRAIEVVARHAAGSGLAIGAGTVLSIQAAERAVAAGASFLVMPHADLSLIAWAAERGIAAFPGAFTPTEILAAWRAGAAAVKLFPASVAGPAFVRELRGPFREIPLVPTGGVTIDTAPAFIRAGAVAVGLGSWLTGDGAPVGIAERAAAVVAAVAEARTGR
jgi:2-dehydro-3-deoxyphosphogluconate aldolase/(4S)-4-hydroxy-2-oxoglutarate aldolase